MAGIDLLKAINKASDVVHNRPWPLREFDQIYMKTGDLVAQSEVVAGWAHGKRLAFIGDGDAVSVCVAYLRDPEMFDFGPSKVTMFDFDQRIVNAVKRFAEKQRIDGILDAVWYNVLGRHSEMSQRSSPKNAHWLQRGTAAYSNEPLRSGLTECPTSCYCKDGSYLA